MNEQVSKISTLITRLLNNDIDEDGKKELAAWKEQSDENRLLYEKLTSEEQLFAAIRQSDESKKRIFNKVKQELPELDETDEVKVITIHRFSWRKMAVAAAIVFAIATGAYMWLEQDRKTTIADRETTEDIISDKPPGKNGAILQLANGKQIVLDDMANGNLAQQGNTQIIKQEGLLSYTNEKPTTEVLYNTLTTPRGRQFQLQLPDGSMVWLNAASTIRFPNVFAGKERIVEITGEVYMEVASLNRKEGLGKVPFIVRSNGMQVEVLGTHFNINAYDEEDAIETTLLEGKVRVSSGQTAALLKPGQQAKVKAATTGADINVIENADVDAAISWKNGMIYFTHADIKEILRQVSRWYDVDIDYKGTIKEQEISGKVPRNIPLLDVLKALELSSNLRFTLENNKIIVQTK